MTEKLPSTKLANVSRTITRPARRLYKYMKTSPASESRRDGDDPSYRDTDGLSPVRIARQTLDAIQRGGYELDGITYRFYDTVRFMRANTLFFPETDLGDWSTTFPLHSLDDSRPKVRISVVEVSTMEGARSLHEELMSSPEESKAIGVLNFASAKSPGGGFLDGSRAQEESIARSSTMFYSLVTPTAQNFYDNHRRDPRGGFYSHAMIYSPRVQFVRSYQGGWQPPLEVNIITSCAVNAGAVRKRSDSDEAERQIDLAMKERMARILYLFERQGVRNVVLGSFGTGSFRNNVELVLRIWGDLLSEENARYARSFDRVIFAILGHQTFSTFDNYFNPKPGAVDQALTPVEPTNTNDSESV